jgi:hypothetical protein
MILFFNLNTDGIICQEILDKNFKQVILEAERSRKDAFVELLKRKDTESRVAGVIARVCKPLILSCILNCTVPLQYNIIGKPNGSFRFFNIDFE